MDSPIISKKIFYFVTILTLFFCSYYFFSNYFHSHTTINVCNSTSGVMIHMRVKNSIDVVLYPDTSKIQNTLICLGKNMPFYDKNIEFLFTKNAFLETKQYKELSKYYKVTSLLTNIRTKSDINNLNTIEIKKDLMLKLKGSTLFIKEDVGQNIITYSQEDYKMIIFENTTKIDFSNYTGTSFNDVIIAEKNSKRNNLELILSSMKPRILIINDSSIYFKNTQSINATNIVNTYILNNSKIKLP